MPASAKASPPRARVSLASLADQTDPQVVRHVLLSALDEICVMAEERVRSTVDGKKEWADPDYATSLKAIELAAKITGAVGIDPDQLLRFKGAAEELVRRASESLRKSESRVVQVISAKATEKPKSPP